jgi:hypothetical protein
MSLSPDDAASQPNSAADRKLSENVPAETRWEGKSRQATRPGLIPITNAERGFWQDLPPRLEHLVSFGPQVALATCLFGFAWAAGSYFSGDQSSLFSRPKPPASPSIAQQERIERAELAREVQKMAADIRALQASMETLRDEQGQAAKTRSSFDGLTARLDAVRNEASAAIAAMAVKAERVQREPEAKMPQVIDRLDRLERKLTTSAAMASAAPAAAGATQRTAQIAADPARLPQDGADGSRKSHLITNWVVRDVYGGIALLESTHGTIEVAPGEIVPGAGRVKSIERRGPGWIVITSQGLVDSARDVFLP